jgi:hypothetical protein
MMMTLIDTRTARDDGGLEAPAGSAGRRCECGGGDSRNDQKLLRR